MNFWLGYHHSTLIRCLKILILTNDQCRPLTETELHRVPVCSECHKANVNDDSGLGWKGSFRRSFVWLLLYLFAACYFLLLLLVFFFFLVAFKQHLIRLFNLTTLAIYVGTCRSSEPMCVADAALLYLMLLMMLACRCCF